MHRFLLVLFVIISTKSFAQTNADWIQHNGAYTTDRGTAVYVDAHANVIAGGFFTDTLFLNNQTHYGHGFIDGYVSKMDSSGNYVWISLVNGPKDDIVERVVTLDNGDVIATGTFADSVQIGNLTTYAQANDDVWLARLDGVSGDPVWLISAGSYYAYERVGGLGANANEIFWAINYGADLIIGNDTVTAVGYSDALVATVDANGNILQKKILSGSDIDNINDIACDVSGNVYAGGRFKGTLLGDTAVSGFDLFYCKFNTDSLEWLKTDGGWNAEAVTAVSTNGESIFVAGLFSDTLKLADTLLLPDAVWSDQVFVMRIDPTGNSNWFFVGFPDSGADYISDIAVSCNGDLLFTGLTTFFASQSPDAPRQTANNGLRCAFGDTYIARMNNSGELLWIKNTLGTNLNSGLSIAADSSGHIYVTGYFTDSLYLANASIKGNGGNDNFLFRINDPFIACETGDTTIVTNLAWPQQSQPYLYPNPSNETAFLFMNSHQPVRVSLSDASGKMISQTTVTPSAVVPMFQLFGKQQPGVYFVTLDSSAARQTLKWVVTP